MCLILVLGVAHALVYEPSEPFYNNDETRHVMTGVFFRDFLLHLPLSNPIHYITTYYLQYPALGFPYWPPLFHIIEGIFMSVFGISFLVSKIVIGVFAAVACLYLFLLVNKTHNTTMAILTVLIFGFSPIIFLFSNQVMLEMPTLAWGLMATYHFIRYLDLEQRLDLFTAALASAFAALTRFSGIYLLPLFLILLIARKRLDILRRGDVVLASIFAIFLVLPFYGITALKFGWVYEKINIEGVISGSGSSRFLAPANFLFYLKSLPSQIGLFILVPALIGVISGMSAERRKACWPYLAMAIAPYLTFSPLPLRDSRFMIYWVPAFSFFAVAGIVFVAMWLKIKKLAILLSFFVIVATAWTTLKSPSPFVRGYEEAAQYILSNTRNSRICLFDGGLNGNFIYQIRQHDPDNRFWVLRGDRLFYSAVIFPRFNYKEFSKNEEDILATIFKYDPEFILLEEPRTFGAIPMANLLREVLKNHPERFQLETVIPLRTNRLSFQGVKLKIYRSILRNPYPERRLEIEVPGLRRTIRAVIPP
jgi:hypothetical protein